MPAKHKTHLLNNLGLPTCGLKLGNYRYGTNIRTSKLNLTKSLKETTCQNCLDYFNNPFNSSSYRRDYYAKHKQACDAYSTGYRSGATTMTREQQFYYFTAGWRTNRDKIINEIESYSSDWLPNGPSKATAEAILKKIRAISEPKSEDYLNIEENKDV